MAAVDPWQIQADPEWALAIIVAAVDYAVVVRTFERRGSPTPTWRRACFATGLALIAIGLLSPLEHIALTSLLSAHLLQNVILADWAPPLLVLGLTPAMIAAAERCARPRFGAALAGRRHDLVVSARRTGCAISGAHGCLGRCPIPAQHRPR